MLWLTGQSRLLIPGVMLVLVLIGLFAPVGVGVVALALVLLFLVWLSFLSWPVLDPSARLVRVIADLILLAAIVARATGKL
jgi:hypothetical protein